ncbi:hypothetical protein ACLB2K_064857 [Fragaria x ananassa]
MLLNAGPTTTFVWQQILWSSSKCHSLDRTTNSTPTVPSAAVAVAATAKALGSSVSDSIQASGNFCSHNTLTEIFDLGSEMSPELLSTIEHSHLAIVVISPNYASSTWCLDGLAKIIESMNPRDKRILPVFLNVDPSDVRYQKNSFAEAFAKHEVKFSDDPKKVEKWRHALRKVANLSGWDAKNYKCERELTDVIVKSVWEKLCPTITLSNSEEKLVEMDFRLGQMRLLLALEEKDVRFIGVWGMGGVGKTILAKLVYENIFHRFEVAEFLVDVRKSHRQLVNLQKQVLFPVLKENVLQVWDEYKGTLLFRKCMSNKKVLLVVDDVDWCDFLKKLAVHKSWFAIRANDCEALELFCLNAFKKDLSEEGFSELSKCFIDYVEGLPLALKIVGSSLYNRDLETWESAWDRLKKGSDAKIFNSLKISYDALDYMEKNIFLDVAFFYKGMNKGRVIELLKSCDFSGHYGIEVLIEKSLITIDAVDNVGMHGLIQEMAQEIVRLETQEPGLRSRLSHRNDIFHVFTTNTGTEAIKGIRLSLLALEETDSNWNFECFSKMLKLMFLEFDNLILWDGRQDLPKLKRMDLTVSKYLKKTPDFTGMPNLEELILIHCEGLVEVHPSIAVHKKLKLLTLPGCKNVKSFPSKIEMDSLEILDLSYCSKLKILEFGEGMEKLEVLNMIGCPKLKKLVGNRGETECLKPSMRSFTNEIFSMLSRLAAQGISPDFLSYNHIHSPFDIVSPGSRISEWFDIRSEGGLLTVELPLDRKNCKSEWMGIVLCVVFADLKEPQTLEFVIEGVSPPPPVFSPPPLSLSPPPPVFSPPPPSPPPPVCFNLVVGFKHMLDLRNPRHMKGDHLWVSFMPRSVIQDTTNCSFTFSFDAYCGDSWSGPHIPYLNCVKRCGA